MKDYLLETFGLRCWGCDFVAPDERHLQLDHVDPKADGGSNHLDNRALLCGPCNITKGNRITTSQLRRENAKSGYPAKRVGSRRRSTFGAKPPVQPTTADGAQEPEMDRIPNIIAEFNKT